jgi:hypothetical protein
MTQVSSTITINAPADAIWPVISDLRAACHYLAMFVNCTVEGEGVGALRTLTSADGTTIVERLDALDQAAHRLRYSLLTDTHFRNCLTTVTVCDLGEGQCELEWSATFQPDGLPAGEAQEMLEGALAANCVALK